MFAPPRVAGGVFGAGPGFRAEWRAAGGFGFYFS